MQSVPSHISRVLERLRFALDALQSSFRLSENTFLIILAGIIGLLGGLGNYAFRKTIEFVHWAIFEQSEQLFGYSLEEWSLTRLAVVFCPVIGGLLVIPLWYWFGKDLKGGFSAFLERVNLRGAKLRLRPIFTRGFGSAITLGAGGSAGQEGPIAMIGGAIGSQFGEVFKISGDRLKVRWDVDNLPMRALIPSLTIQPLLENAIYHGIELLPEGGAVTVTGKRVDDSLDICISNPVATDQVRRTGGNKMAMSNIRQRFELAYGSRSQVNIDTGDETYQVHLVFPFEEGER